MKRPLFSIIIPTKNRAFLVGFAIRSALQQTCADFEIVVIDNDDTGQTGEVVAAFRDPRLRSVRTGGLTMPDNWEAGYASATGELLLVLEDKSVLKAHALAKIRDRLAATPADVVSWPQDIFDDLCAPPRIVPAGGSGVAAIRRPEEILRIFLDRPRAESDRFMPRGLNSCMSRGLYARILRGPAGRACPANFPDYGLAFLQLAHADAVLHLDEALTVFGSCFHSQGRRVIVKADSAADLARNISADFEAFTDKVPLKRLIVANVLFNDYLRIREQVKGRLERVPVNWAAYYLECHSDIEVSRRFGVDVAEDRAAWEAALAGEPASVRETVAAALTPRVPLLKRLGKRMRLHLLHQRWLDWRAARSAPPTFANAFEYVNWLNRDCPR